MCGGSGPWASTTVVLSASTGSAIFSEDRVFSPLDTGITRRGSPGLRGPRASGLLDMGGLMGYEDTRPNTLTRVRMGLSLA